MFDSVGWAEILVLMVAGLFILGPERLPAAAAWVGRSMRQVREFATGARDQLRDELGPEFDELRKPLEDLRGLRSFNPRTAVRRTFLDDLDEKPNGYAGGAKRTRANGAGSDGGGPGSNGGAGTPERHPAMGAAPEKLAPGEQPPIDPDAT